MGGRGRGRGGGGGSTTVRAVANALGIARHDMANYVQSLRTEAPPTYPPLQRALIPLEIDPELDYMASTKTGILQGFQLSPFYLKEKQEDDIKRYTDKYNESVKERLMPDFSRIPEELCWQKKRAENKAKKRKVEDVMSEVISEKLKKLEEQDNAGEGEEEREGEESDDQSEKVVDEAVSDDDYLEEDNDYAQGYFDNGEAYGDVGSDDNMDADEY